ncbi:MAG: hypothetical protein K1X74_11885 [Pirellulales bacterium]|nr:hypothetical protein [Pirellulales bacterium]
MLHGLLVTLLNVLTAAHLLAVNLATAGPLVAQWLHRRERRNGDLAAGLTGRRLIAQSLLALVWSVLFGLLGVGLLAWLYPRAWFDTLLQVPARRLWFGAIELVFSGVCLLAYLYGWQRFSYRSAWGWLHAALPALAATNLAYHFAGLFAIVAVAATDAGLSSEHFDFLTLVSNPEVLSRVLHNVLSAAAVAGVAMMLFARASERYGAASADVARLVTWGARVALVPTLLQTLAGMHLLLQLPEESRNLLLGGDVRTTAMFGLSMAAALALAYQLATTAQGETEASDVRRAVGWLLWTVLLMVAARQAARGPALERRERPPAAAHSDLSPNDNLKLGALPRSTST